MQARDFLRCEDLGEAFDLKKKAITYISFQTWMMNVGIWCVEAVASITTDIMSLLVLVPKIRISTTMAVLASFSIVLVSSIFHLYCWLGTYVFVFGRKSTSCTRTSFIQFWILATTTHDLRDCLISKEESNKVAKTSNICLPTILKWKKNLLNQEEIFSSFWQSRPSYVICAYFF